MIPLLIVDDESIIRETIAAMLRRKYPDQFHIFLASNGQEALSLVASENVELVLADIKMPVMNGLELLHRLHEQQLQCDVIFISGFDDYSFVREAMKSGAVDYLLKPIAENELYAQIDSFLKRAALRVPIHTARIRPEENVYLQQYVLDKLFDSNGIVPDGVLTELHLTPSSPAALLAAPVVSSEADLQWFQQVHEAIQPLLQTGCALFQGRKRQMCLSLCIFPDQSQYTAMGGLLPGNSAQVLSPMFLLPHAPEQLSVCQTLLERRFFDLLFQHIGLRPGFWPTSPEVKTLIVPEGDIGGGIACFALKLLTGGHVNYIEPFHIDLPNHGFDAGHAGPNDYTDPRGKCKISSDVRFAKTKWKYAGAPFAWYVFPEGEKTMLHCWQQTGKFQFVAAQIEAVHTDHFLATYSHSHFRPVGESCTELFTKLLRQGVTQHYGIVDGNVQAELQDLAMMMNFEFERV